MKTKVLHTILILSLCSLALLALGGEQTAQAQEAVPLAPEALSDEAWRYGLTVEGGAMYYLVEGRLLSETAAFRSFEDDDIYFIFPAPGSTKSITAIRYCIVSRGGAYTGDAMLSLEIRNLAGALQHTVTAAPVDLEAATIGTWHPIAISGTAANRVVSPGEYLAFHFNLSGAAGGTLTVRPMFEVILQ
jgi:hypothetical protein